MKILQTLNSSQPGGMEYHTYDLVKGLIKDGHEVHVWCIGDPIAQWFKDAGAITTNNEVKVTFGLDIDPAYIVKLYKYIKQNKIDIVHCHGLRANANTLIAATLANVTYLSSKNKIVKVSHIHTPFDDWPISPLKKFIYKNSYGIATSLLTHTEIALTNHIKQLKQKWGVPIDKLEVIPNGFDQEIFDPKKYNKSLHKEEMSQKYGFPENKFIFGNTSRLSVNKGTDLLLKAFAKLLNEDGKSTGQNTHLLLAGKGEEIEMVNNQIEDLNLQDHVTLTGTFPDEDRVKLYNSLDAFVFPSHSEGFGLVLIEAMAMNIPTVAADLPVLQEVGDKYVYRYFDRYNSDSIYEAMVDLRNNYEDAVELSAYAKEYVNNLYTIESFIDNYENLYSRLLTKVRNLQ